MKLSKKTEYSLRVIFDFALHAGDGYVSLSDTAVRLGVSKQQLEQILLRVSKSQLIVAARGASGGYKLSKKPSLISLAEVLSVADPDLLGDLENFSELDTDDDGKMMTREIWLGVSKAISDYAHSLTLQDLIDMRISVAGFDFSI